MILFHSESDFVLPNKSLYKKWIKKSVVSLAKEVGNINYIFCDDDYLLKINKEYLNHNTYTDIISFDYSEKNKLSGDIYISIDSLTENAKSFDNTFQDELNRVLIHGILHFAGFNDKTKAEKTEMRKQEDYYISLLDF